MPTDTSLDTSQDEHAQFFRQFQQEAADLQKSIDNIPTLSTEGRERIDAIDHCGASIAQLSKDVRARQMKTTRHDSQIYAEGIKALSMSLQAIKTQQMRKQKFTFKNSVFKTAGGESTASVDTAKSTQTPAFVPYEALTTLVPQAYDREPVELGISGGKGEYILAGKHTPAVVRDIEDSVVDLTLFLPTIRVRNISRSIVIIPEVAGSVFLECVNHSIVIVGCHQFRMHHSSNVEVYLHCPNTPVIEHSTGIRFAPMPDVFPTTRAKNENRWQFVSDFQWLRAIQSPNWAILEPELRRGADFWKKVRELRLEGGFKESLTALGLP